MSNVKKSQPFKKNNIKLRIEVAEDPQDFEYFLALRSKKKYFFQKAETFLQRDTS